eukprot:232304-Chlamydomonas_euryale.AAC.1
MAIVPAGSIPKSQDAAIAMMSKAHMGTGLLTLKQALVAAGITSQTKEASEFDVLQHTKEGGCRWIAMLSLTSTLFVKDTVAGSAVTATAAPSCDGVPVLQQLGKLACFGLPPARTVPSSPTAFVQVYRGDELKAAVDIGKVIGRGGFGCVHSTFLRGVPCAVKVRVKKYDGDVLVPEILSSGASIASDNIVSLLGYGTIQSNAK